MRSYKVIKDFQDAKDKNYFYHVGDIYPRDGHDPSSERIKALSTNENATRTPLIEEIKSRRNAYTDEINDED